MEKGERNMLLKETVIGYLGRVNMKGREGRKRRRKQRGQKVHCCAIRSSSHCEINRKT